MKTLKLLIVFFISLTLTGYSQNTAKPEKKDNKKAPEITFESNFYDYGIIQQGSDGIHEFVFKNTGKSPLILTNVKSSCGCTVPTWPKTPIKKKKKSAIKVKYNTHRIGNFQKTVTVFSNAKNSPVRLTIKGKVVKKETPKTSPEKPKSILNK